MFTCLEHESMVQEDETHVVQSFVITEGEHAEFAHRALVTLLTTFGNADPLDWHQVLLRKQLPLLFTSPQQAVENAFEAAFIQYKINIRPKTWPTFIGKRGE